MTAAGVSVRAAVGRFLSSPRCQNPNTRRSYATALEKWAEVIGAHRELGDVGDMEAADAPTELWGSGAPGIWGTGGAPPSPRSSPGAARTAFRPRTCPSPPSAAPTLSVPGMPSVQAGDRSVLDVVAHGVAAIPRVSWLQLRQDGRSCWCAWLISR